MYIRHRINGATIYRVLFLKQSVTTIVGIKGNFMVKEAIKQMLLKFSAIKSTATITHRIKSSQIKCLFLVSCIIKQGKPWRSYTASPILDSCYWSLSLVCLLCFPYAIYFTKISFKQSLLIYNFYLNFHFSGSTIAYAKQPCADDCRDQHCHSGLPYCEAITQKCTCATYLSCKNNDDCKTLRCFIGTEEPVCLSSLCICGIIMSKTT